MGNPNLEIPDKMLSNGDGNFLPDNLMAPQRPSVRVNYPPNSTKESLGLLFPVVK